MLQRIKLSEETVYTISYTQIQSNGAAYVGNIRLQTSHKLALSFAILFIVVTSAFWLLFQNELNRSLREYSDILGTSLAEQTATSVRELVLVNDPLGLNVVLTQLVRDSNIVYAVVYDVDGRQLASAGQASINTANATIIPAQQGFYSADITVQDAIAGSIQLELDSMDFLDIVMELRKRTFALARPEDIKGSNLDLHLREAKIAGTKGRPEE